MKERIVITLPNSDLVTSYLTAFSKEIILFAEQKGMAVKTLEGAKANRDLFENCVKKLNPTVIIFNGHGSDRCITGQKEEPLVVLGENHAILLNKIIYARSCYAARGIGNAFVEQDEGCFIGYKLPFMFLSDIDWATNPLKDKMANKFLRTSNLVPQGILKGNSALEASEKCKKHILKIMKKALLKKDKDSEVIAETLWNNYQAQVVLGNKNIKLV